MQVIYLDQNAASFLAKSNSEKIWQEIKEALVDGFRNRKLICPLPFEGVVESASCSLELRQSIQALFWQLSEGVAFKPFHEMSNELTLALIRPIQNWSPFKGWKPIWAEMGYAAHNIRSSRNSAKKTMMERMNAFVQSPEAEQMEERDLFHIVAAQRSGWICNDLDCLLAGGRITESSFKCSVLIEYLISANLKPAEIEALKRAVQHHGWIKIPIHAFEALLGAKWEYDSIRGGAAAYEPNDEIDRMRAAIALDHSDIFITEGDLANLCHKAKLNEFSPTLVLSVRNPEEILKTVRSIIAN
jgi:hypothetical protein